MKPSAWLAACVALTLAARGYLAGSALLFFASLGCLVAACAAVAWLGRGEPGSAAPRLALAGLSGVITFLLVEGVWAVADALPTAGRRGPTIRWEGDREDRQGFRLWWRQHLARWARLDPRLVGPDPSGRNPYVLIPGASLQRGGSRLRVNALGFRGDEIERPKGARFRVVALGESTTFGLTVEEGDRTWPELLEARIARDWSCPVPVEVINAGVPGWTLANQLERISDDVFPLEPDLLLSYHGVNGFAPLFRVVPGLHFAEVADLRERPSRVLERLERTLRLRAVRRAQPAADFDPGLGAEELLATGYGRRYRELAARARARGIDLGIASFNLAVNASSPGEVIAFYESFASDTRSAVVANRLHNRLVRLVARRTDARFVDATPGLDGSTDAYVDLMHFTEQGRERLAANFLAGMERILRHHPRLGCRERARARRPHALDHVVSP